MEQTLISEVLISSGLTIFFIFTLVIVPSYFFLKNILDKIKKQQAELNKQRDELGKNNQYDKSMSQLMLEEQKIHLHSMACTLDFLVKKNELQIEHGLIPSQVGQYRNSQLLDLKESLMQYADSLEKLVYS